MIDFSEPFNIESNLALPYLYYSKIDLCGSLRFAFRQYITTSEIIVDTPNHLLVNLLILASIASTDVEKISLIRSGQRSKHHTFNLS